jgi:hypothetical protein
MAYFRYLRGEADRFVVRENTYRLSWLICCEKKNIVEEAGISKPNPLI